MAPERGPYRGALFGSGGVARQSHIPAYQQGKGVADRMRLVVAVDDADDVPPMDGLPHVRSRDRVAEFGPIDFLDICTPTASHLDLTLWGLAQGYHVLCEKPVAVTVEEAERIRRAARAAGRVVVPCHQYRYNPAWQQLRAWLDEGAIGHWHLAEFRVFRAHADPGARPAATPWRGTRGEARGGVLLDHGTHLLYLMLDVAGRPAGLHAWIGRLRHQQYEVEDTAQLLLEYPDRFGTIFVTWAATRRENTIRFLGERGTIDWVGGELRLDAEGRRESLDFTAALDKSAYKDWFARLFLEAADAMASGGGGGAGGGGGGGAGERYLDEIAEVADVLERAYRVAAERDPASGAGAGAGAGAGVS